jgi:hypothetical protein
MNASTKEPGHEIAIVVGRTGSGKTALISEVLAPRHPRRITIDVTGECEELYPDAFVAVGYAQVMQVVGQWAKEDRKLARAMVPVYRPGVTSLSADLGGVCIECSELDVYLPVSGANADVSAAWTTVLARGRHAHCSVIAATQRPAQIARVVTSQASRVIAFATHEPTDLKWLARAGGMRYAKAVQTLGRFQSAWYYADTGNIEIRDAGYEITRSFWAHEGARAVQLDMEDEQHG